jgi:hypothetical protein
MYILDRKIYEVAIGKHASNHYDVYLTPPERSYSDCLESKTPFIAITIQDQYKPFIRVIYTGCDMIRILDESEPKFEQLEKMARRIIKEEEQQ